MYGSWDMVQQWQTDEKSDIEVVAPPKKNKFFEQSATLFGMKQKNRIVNQILLFKL